MAGNTFGEIFKVTTFGESHGAGIGLVIDGCPAGFQLDLEHIQSELNRRRPGQSRIVTQRKENDEFSILSGVINNITTGTPLSFFIHNEDQKSQDYSHIEDKFRPSHADYTYQIKYGIRDMRGGGRSSARETAARVIAGAVCKQILLKQYNVHINAFVSKVGHISLPLEFEPNYTLVESNMVRCPDPDMAEQMITLINEVRKSGDTIGGMVTCHIRHCPVGLGEPVFDKLHADLAKAMLSINAVKGFEYGSGFKSTEMKGSEHNDIFINNENSIETATNNSGGIQGGISNGMPINFNVAFKPVATIIPSQETVDINGNPTTIVGKGRHDPCVVPRAVPIVESMAAIVIMDHVLRQRCVQL